MSRRRGMFPPSSPRTQLLVYLRNVPNSVRFPRVSPPFLRAIVGVRRAHATILSSMKRFKERRVDHRAGWRRGQLSSRPAGSTRSTRQTGTGSKRSAIAQQRLGALRRSRSTPEVRAVRACSTAERVDGGEHSDTIAVETAGDCGPPRPAQPRPSINEDTTNIGFGEAEAASETP